MIKNINNFNSLNIYINHYHSTLNSKDKIVRQNLYNYKNININLIHKFILWCDIYNANKILYNFNYNLYCIPWNIKFIDDKLQIENNFPHTHYDTIFFPYPKYFNFNKNKRINLLIHEKIHIFQRFNPIQYHKLLGDFKIIGLRSSHNDYKNSRTNPDINDLIYNSNNCLQIYKKYPEKLTDSFIKSYEEKICKYEHPNEEFAYKNEIKF